MSFLLPFEVQTETGWKQAEGLKEGDSVMCLEEGYGLAYKKIRQCLIYNSKFTFTEFSNGPFRFGVCEGVPISPFFLSSMPCPEVSTLALECKPEELQDGEYNPDPDLVFQGSLSKIDSLQIEAVSKGVHAVVEHWQEPKFRLTEMPFSPWGMADSFGRKAIALSCYENKPTHLLVRLAALEECYKTFALIV